MKQVHILADDFIDNIFGNMLDGLEGCPLERAMFRADLTLDGKCADWKIMADHTSLQEAHTRIFNMFNGLEPIQSFTIEIPIL